MSQVVLCIFCAMNSFLTLVRAFSFAYGGLRAAVRVHETLLYKIVNAPVKFFNQTPSGRILNRLEIVDRLKYYVVSSFLHLYSWWSHAGSPRTCIPLTILSHLF